MKVVNNNKEIILNATHEVKCRMHLSTYENWELLKSKLQATTGKTYSDSAFFNWCINELATLTFLAVC